ncbi:MAG: hypothetical protein KF757_02310 [Phycisphaeraceae bacterium]|nr:hypothetical protein [Phycisphaeraceae bacterium]MCW5762046.1 hypothetical protein [Phycisphaeraceae bacterium]
MRPDDTTQNRVNHVQGTTQPDARRPWLRGRPIESFRADLRAHFDRWRNIERQTSTTPHTS